MRRRTMFSIAAVCAAIALPQVTHAFEGKRGTTVNAVSDTVFEVVARTAGSAQEYWCGAADYARSELGVPWSAKITLVRGRGPSETTGRRSAVQYSLADAAGIARERLIVQFGQLLPGQTMTVSNAYRFCAGPVGRR